MDQPDHRTGLRPEGHPESELINALEPDQLVATSSVPLPPMRLSRRVKALFWVLRMFALVISGLIVYIFVEAVRTTH